MFAAALLLAACGSTNVPSPSASPSVEPTVAPPLDPGVLGLTCGDGLVFHPSLLEVLGRAEAEPDAAAEALRLHLAASPNMPRSKWIRVAQRADKAQFVARDIDGDGWVVIGVALFQGRWGADFIAECHPEVALPAGVGRADWRLDPAFPRPGVGDRTVRILIHERTCASGQSPEGRVLAPIVASSHTAITIAILVTQLGGDCQGTPEFPLTVDLPEPLGGRTLLDGAVYPPRDISQPAP